MARGRPSPSPDPIALDEAPLEYIVAAERTPTSNRKRKEPPSNSSRHTKDGAISSSKRPVSDKHNIIRSSPTTPSAEPRLLKHSSDQAGDGGGTPRSSAKVNGSTPRTKTAKTPNGTLIRSVKAVPERLNGDVSTPTKPAHLSEVYEPVLLPSRGKSKTGTSTPAWKRKLDALSAKQKSAGAPVVEIPPRPTQIEFYEPVLLPPRGRSKTSTPTPKRPNKATAAKTPSKTPVTDGKAVVPLPVSSLPPPPKDEEPFEPVLLPARPRAPKLVTPRRETSTTTPAKKTATPTLASSLKALPTPSPASRKRPRLASPTKSASKTNLTFDDETFGAPSPSTAAAVSRETFLANEALRRQREARNYKYTGDANAPKLTRSGRIIGEVEAEDEDDGYGETPAEETVEPMEPEPEERAERRETSPLVEELGSAEDGKSIPDYAKPYILDILANLTGSNVASTPPPFANEDKNEALNGLVNLLKGTVERGEGNSALIVGARGVGKTRTVSRALDLLPSSSKSAPIVVRLSGLAQTNDRLAIREMGSQIAEAEGKKIMEEEDGENEEEGHDETEYAPTTLPSHLLALLTAPSPRSIVIVIDEFDLFTEHARQALLYCLLDVVQSVKTGPVATTGRGIAVIGVTSRVDTLLLLEKRVKSRFSHRMWRVISPLAPDQLGWKETVTRVLTPWTTVSNPDAEWRRGKESEESLAWQSFWEAAVEALVEHPKAVKGFERLVGLTTDVRLLYRPLIVPVTELLAEKGQVVSVVSLVQAVLHQVENAAWGLATSKLKGLPQPATGVLIIAKHLSFAGRDEFTFAMVEEEYLKFSRSKLVGSGRSRWPLAVLKSGFDHLLRLSVLTAAAGGSVKPRFARIRCTLAPHEIVAWMKGEGAVGMGPEMVGWGRMMGGHV